MNRFLSAGFVLYWTCNQICWKGAFFVMVQAMEEIIAKSSSIVFFGGAGFSTESGIPAFRSVDGH